jgi:hypothetical protein
MYLIYYIYDINGVVSGTLFAIFMWEPVYFVGIVVSTNDGVGGGGGGDMTEKTMTQYFSSAHTPLLIEERKRFMVILKETVSRDTTLRSDVFFVRVPL